MNPDPVARYKIASGENNVGPRELAKFDHLVFLGQTREDELHFFQYLLSVGIGDNTYIFNMGKVAITVSVIPADIQEYSLLPVFSKGWTRMFIFLAKEEVVNMRKKVIVKIKQWTVFFIR
jgi:hypothetical protein